MPAIIPVTENPFVGPRTFERAQGHLFFGREAEARDLLSRVVSERLLLFYAQSGAGKSSLINARLIPALQETGFAVLPVGRVSGELPPGVVDVPNIFLFNLAVSLDEGENNPNLLAAVSFGDFLARLASEDGVRWAYDPNLDIASPAPNASPGADAASGQQPFVLIIDQFEEIITAQPGRWQERAGFFTALNQALLDDPNLWVVLTLREDYVAALDPYAPLLFNRLRARFYMERMGVAAALDAVSKPAELGGRPFDPGVAEQLVDNLRQVRIPGQEQPQPGQYVEPVQLQVVCYQLWENIKRRAPGPITAADLREAGDVDKALVQFYEETLTAVLADPVATGLTERQLRTWFSTELITESETRGLVHQGKRETGSLPNPVVRKLQSRFLVRAETRAGGTWVELVHDRFVEPILTCNSVWFGRNQSPITQAALAWDAAGQPSNMLLSGDQLQLAQTDMAANAGAYSDTERSYVNASQLQDAKARARRLRRLITVLAGAGLLVIVGAVLAGVSAVRANQSALEARQAQETAVVARVIALSQFGTAVAARQTSDALAIIAQQALNEKVALLETAQAPTPTPAQPTATPVPQVVAAGDSTPQPTPTPTVDFDATATASALALQLEGARAAQTAVAQIQASNAPQVQLPDRVVGTFQTGDIVVPVTPSNLRKSPGFAGKASDDVVAMLTPGLSLLILDGPTPLDGINWWRVSGIAPSQGQVFGWVAETVAGQPLIQFAPRLSGTDVPDPATGTYLRAPFDGAYGIGQLYGENAALYSNSTYDGVPLKGNNGVDFLVPLGTPLYAVDDGVVARTDLEEGGAGNFVLIEHGWGESLYSQMDSLAVAEGQVVHRGELIGYSGNSGLATGPHLDFKMRISPYVRTDGWGGFSDPLPYLPPSSYVLPPYMYETTTQ